MQVQHEIRGCAGLLGCGEGPVRAGGKVRIRHHDRRVYGFRVRFDRFMIGGNDIAHIFTPAGGAPGHIHDASKKCMSGNLVQGLGGKTCRAMAGWNDDQGLHAGPHPS